LAVVGDVAEPEGDVVEAEGGEGHQLAIPDEAGSAGSAGSAGISSLIDSKVLCDSCGRFETYSACRLLSKMKSTWRCNGCGVKATQLRRVFGSWPTENFCRLSKDSSSDGLALRAEGISHICGTRIGEAGNR
jgi:hypothetical protein